MNAIAQDVIISPQGEANFFAVMQGEKVLGEVKVNGAYCDDEQVELAGYAANYLQARFPIAPSNATWEVSDEPNRMTLVRESDNRRDWVLVLTH